MTTAARRWKSILLLLVFLSICFSGFLEAQIATPSITSITPDSSPMGGAGFTLTVNGSGFSGGYSGNSSIRWNGNILATTIVSNTQATAEVPAYYLSSPHAASITFVITYLATPGTLTSNSVTFWVLAPLNTLTPPFAMAGEDGFTLTLDGDFSSMVSPIVQWNGSNRTTTSVSQSRVTAAIPATDIASAGTIAVRVYSGIPYGRGPSIATNTLNFTVDPTLTLTGINPVETVAGGPSFQLTLNGTGFRPEYGSRVLWNGQIRSSTIDSTTRITATIPASDIVTRTTVNVAVNNVNQKRTSNSLTFSVTAPTPIIRSLSPESILAGSAGFTLTVNGSNFLAPPIGSTATPGSTIRWNGVNLPTSFVDSNRLTAFINAGNVSTAGLANITVSNESLGGEVSNVAVFTINNPSPTIDTINPTSVLAGSGSLTLTVNGTGFISDSTILYQGSNRPTTFVSNTQLRATLPPSDFVRAGSGSVTVFNPSPGGGTSNALTFTVNAPNAIIESLSPQSVLTGSAGFTLTVIGSNFLAPPIGTTMNLGSVIRWNGANRTTSYIDSTHLSTIVTASDIATAGQVDITVSNEALGGGISNVAVFTINNPLPTLSEINPTKVTAGSSSLALLVTGTGFVSNSTVRYQGSDRPTTFVSSTQLRVTLPASDFAKAGTVSITVFNPSPGGGTSEALTIAIIAPNAIIDSLSPQSILAGSAGFTLTVNGTNFLAPTTGDVATPGSVIRWNGANRPTSYIDSTHLTTPISAGDISTAALVDISVSNEALGGGISNVVVFTINNPLPTITGINPTRVLPGSGSLSLAVSGTGFVSGSTIRYQGSNRTTTVVSNTQLQATLPASDFTNAGTVSITVFNPSPGGGTSAPFTFTVLPVVPVFTLTGLPAAISPAQQIPVGASIGAAYPVDITGLLTLSFAPDAVNPLDDPAIQFISGGRTVSFTIPAGRTQALFGTTATTATFQTGTVSGTITIHAAIQIDKVSVPLSPNPNRSLSISRQVPKIVSATIGNKTASGFNLQIIAYATPRSVSQATFSFSSSGSGPLSNNVFTKDISSLLTTWYKTSESASYGSQFKLTVPFTVSGPIEHIGSVYITLSNEVGVSEQVRIYF